MVNLGYCTRGERRWVSDGSEIIIPKYATPQTIIRRRDTPSDMDATQYRTYNWETINWKALNIEKQILSGEGTQEESSNFSRIYFQFVSTFITFLSQTLSKFKTPEFLIHELQL